MDAKKELMLFKHNRQQLEKMTRLRDADIRKYELRTVKDNIDNPPDVDLWCVLPRWTNLQAIALITGVNPCGLTASTWLDLSDYFNSLKFKEFHKRYTVLVEDIKYKEITYETQHMKVEDQVVIKPIDIINWAKKRGFPIPKDVKERVLENNKAYVDWESKYKELEAKIIQEEKPIHHKTKDSYKRAIATLGFLYFKSKTKDNFNANNLYKLTKGSAKFQKELGEYNTDFELLCEDTWCDILKEVRPKLGLEPTAKKKNNNPK